MESKYHYVEFRTIFGAGHDLLSCIGCVLGRLLK